MSISGPGAKLSLKGPPDPVKVPSIGPGIPRGSIKDTAPDLPPEMTTSSDRRKTSSSLPKGSTKEPVSELPPEMPPGLAPTGLLPSPSGTTLSRQKTTSNMSKISIIDPSSSTELRNPSGTLVNRQKTNDNIPKRSTLGSKTELRARSGTRTNRRKTGDTVPKPSMMDLSSSIIPPPPPKNFRLVGSNLLLEILLPKSEPLPVILPHINERRKARHSTRISTTHQPQKTALFTPAIFENAVPFIEGDDAPNPFIHPDNIEEYIAQTDLEKAEKRKKDASVPPLMKGTNLYQQNQVVLSRIKPFLHPGFKPSLAQDYKLVVWKAQHGLHINHLQKVSRKMHTEYIMQRKEIYYLRRAIRARKIALEMVHRTKEFEESCLSDFEWLTSFTKDAFENFLRENDEQTHAASRLAEAALKEKLEKNLEARKLNIEINQIKTDILSTNESLRECKSYMTFLDDIAREIMRKDEEEEIRAHHREQQIKEEIMNCLKMGMTLKKAQETVEERAKAFGEEHWQMLKSRGSFGNGSADFITTLNKQIRKNLGMPEDILEDFEDKNALVAVAPDYDHDQKRMSIDDDEIEEEEEPEHQEVSTGILTPKTLIASLVTRNKSRLVNVTGKHEKALMSVMKPNSSDNAPTSASSDVRRQLLEDEDGYNEKALVSSLDLEPGDEFDDRMELANLSFTRPSQLLQIYSDMEEVNLSLIQHSQASEEMLERVNQQISETRRALNHRGRLLRSEINQMQTKIDMNEERAHALKMLVEMFTGGNYDVRQQQKLYRILQRQVTKVYKTAVGNVDQHLNPIMMLTSIEKNFEDLMREIQAMPTEVVVQISRELDKERREAERMEKMHQRKAVQEARKSRQLERAAAPVHRRKGRPLLARSHPPKIVIQLSQAELDKKAEEDEFNYFFGP